MLGGCIPDAGKVEVRFSSGKPHYRFSRFVRKNGQESIKGDYEEFYKDGKPRFLVEFAKGQIHGAIRTWSNSGQLNREVYILNGLLHGSYKDFRSERANMRDSDEELNSLILADYLDKYAATGKEYTKIIKQIIKQNNLQDFDKVKLLPSSFQLKNII